MEVTVAIAMPLRKAHQATVALVALVAMAAMAARVALEGLAETVAEGARVSAFLPTRR
jgi:O-acetyl-ADP-ribose deacetylase (regulator of RNase III)